MTINMKQALMLWIDNLLDSKATKFTKTTYLEALEEKGLSCSDSFFKDVKEKLKQIGVDVYYNATDKTYDIDKSDNEEEVFKILYNAKNLMALEIISQRLYAQEALTLTVQLGYNSVNSKGFKYLHKCLDAILSRRFICLKHKRFEKEATRVHPKLKPLFLKEYQNRWYLVVEPTENRDYMMFGLDRIIEMELLDEHFTMDKPINYKMFDDAIGVDLRDEIACVRLKCDKEQMNYIRIAPLHHSQKEEWANEDGMIFTLKVKLNHELKRLIMSYGSHIEVLEPKELRDYVKEEFEKSLQKYK